MKRGSDRECFRLDRILWWWDIKDKVGSHTKLSEEYLQSSASKCIGPVLEKDLVYLRNQKDNVGNR